MQDLVVGLRGLLAGVGTIFGFFAFAHLPLADVYAIAFCTPIVVTLMSIPILGEVVRAHRWAAIIVGFIGILVMIRPGFETLGWGHLTAFLGERDRMTHPVLLAAKREAMLRLVRFHVLGQIEIEPVADPVCGGGKRRARLRAAHIGIARTEADQ